MTPAALIDSALTNFEGLDPNDGGNARARAQLLVLLQMTQDEVEDEREGLSYLYKSANVTILTGTNSIDVPSDFRDIGPEGSVWIPALNRELDGPLHQQEIITRRQGDVIESEVFCYAIWARKFQTITVAQDTVLQVNYLQLSPTLLDDTTDQFLMPPEFHTRVLLPGVLSKCNRIKDELRDTMGDIYEKNKSIFFRRIRSRRGAIQVFPQQEGTLT